MSKKIKIIISGGGTGGHIYPAISIANALKEINSDIDILFVGAEGKMEMEKVPMAGYKIVGLPVVGLQRRLTLKNLFLPIKLVKSLRRASAVIREFQPNIVVGVGGYASGPVLWMAARRGIPTVIQEQNSYAGITNKLLAKKAKLICVAYEGMERFFPKQKIVLTGNPIRQDLVNLSELRSEAQTFFKLNPSKQTILVLGGSLGARTINETLIAYMDNFNSDKVQVIWQTGKFYFTKAQVEWEKQKNDNIKIYDFIYRMDLAYAAADIIISRAGAGTISELCMVGKPCILVPSPNVSEDHQTKNAMALVNRQAALLVADIDAQEGLINQAMELLNDNKLMESLSKNIAALALPNAANEIATKIIGLVNK